MCTIILYKYYSTHENESMYYLITYINYIDEHYYCQLLYHRIVTSQKYYQISYNLNGIYLYEKT